MRVRSRAAPIPTSTAYRPGRSRRWSIRTRALTKANGYMGMVALVEVLSITSEANVNWTEAASQAFWDPLVEDGA